MKQIKMDYGRHGLKINVPDQSDVFTVRDVPAYQNEAKAIIDALHNPIQHTPLRNLVRADMHVLIVHSDITRATPNDRLLPIIIREIEKRGVNSKDITLLNALGTHRPQTRGELQQMLGADIVNHYRCLQHDAFDQSQLVDITSPALGHAVKVNRLLLEADLAILTGFIEPHFFAGYSGGPKAVLPGLAGGESILHNHGPAMIAHPQATFNITQGNPLWEEMKAAVDCIENAFLVNVTLNRNHQITGVFTGDVFAAHQAGCKFVQESCLFSITEPYDLVITSNSGYPLDLNLYQCVKGMAAAKKAVRAGGGILLLGACEEGLPEHGSYAQLLREVSSPDEILRLLSQPGYSKQDTWQVQVQAQVQQHADVYIYSQGLSEDQIKSSLLNPCRDLNIDIPKLIHQYGQRVCVLPQGPRTILEI